jgi:hypothetical protein
LRQHPEEGGAGHLSALIGWLAIAPRDQETVR